MNLKKVFQENKARQIFRKTNISYPTIRTRTCVYQEVRNVRFSKNLACFAFLKHPFWDSAFCLITDSFKKTATNPAKVQIALYRRLYCFIFPTIWGKMRHPKVFSFWIQIWSVETRNRQEKRKKQQQKNTQWL